MIKDVKKYKVFSCVYVKRCYLLNIKSWVIYKKFYKKIFRVSENIWWYYDFVCYFLNFIV